LPDIRLSVFKNKRNSEDSFTGKSKGNYKNKSQDPERIKAHSQNSLNKNKSRINRNEFS